MIDPINTKYIWTDKERCGGKPCIRGTRFPIAQLLREIADKMYLDEVVEDFSLPPLDTIGALDELATWLNEQYTTEEAKELMQRFREEHKGASSILDSRRDAGSIEELPR